MLELHLPRPFLYLKNRLIDRHPRLRRLLLRALVPNQDVPISFLSARLIVNSREEVGYLRAAKMSENSVVLRDELPVLLTLALLLEPGDTFLDIGANVGLYTAVLSKVKWIYPGVKFFAFEPHPQTFSRLRRSLENTNAVLGDFALSDHNTELEFSEGGGSWTFSATRSSSFFQKRSHTRRVFAKRLDSIEIAGDSIVLKIDVEGHEVQVIEGATGLIEAGRVKAIYVDGYADPNLPARLERMGFVLFDGRTLEPGHAVFSLLAISHNHLARWRAGSCSNS